MPPYTLNINKTMFRKIRKIISITIIVSFFITSIKSPTYAQDFSVNQLPVPGTMIGESAPFSPLALKGLIVNLKKPLEFQFIVDTGKGPQDATSIKEEANQLVKYFLAGLTIPEGDLWVNLSPYEKSRMVSEALGQTDLGRDLLAQDYILKQLTASLIYPEKDLGKEFWSRVYAKAKAQFGTTNIPVNTFNKVWILPDQAQVYENKNVAYVTKSTLKVMLDEDYTALQKHMPVHNSTDSIGSQIVREIVIPEITKEVNTGKNFAPLRQIYQALILAKWYKETIQNGLLDAVYTNKNKVAGVNVDDPAVKEQIYNRYLQAYKKGAFNYIKEDPTPDGKVMPKKYFSGGIPLIAINLKRTQDPAMVGQPDGAMLGLTISLVAASGFIFYSVMQNRSLILKAQNGDYEAIEELINNFGRSLPKFYSLIDPNQRNTHHNNVLANRYDGIDWDDIAKSKRMVQINKFILKLYKMGIPKKDLMGCLIKNLKVDSPVEIEILGQLGYPAALVPLQNLLALVDETIVIQVPSKDPNYQWDDEKVTNPIHTVLVQAIEKLSNQATFRSPTSKEDPAMLGWLMPGSKKANQQRKERAIAILQEAISEVDELLDFYGNSGKADEFTQTQLKKWNLVSPALKAALEAVKAGKFTGNPLVESDWTKFLKVFGGGVYYLKTTGSEKDIFLTTDDSKQGKDRAKAKVPSSRPDTAMLNEEKLKAAGLAHEIVIVRKDGTVGYPTPEEIVDSFYTDDIRRSAFDELERSTRNDRDKLFQIVKKRLISNPGDKLIAEEGARVFGKDAIIKFLQEELVRLQANIAKLQSQGAHGSSDVIISIGGQELAILYLVHFLRDYTVSQPLNRDVAMNSENEGIDREPNRDGLYDGEVVGYYIWVVIHGSSTGYYTEMNSDGMPISSSFVQDEPDKKYWERISDSAMLQTPNKDTAMMGDHELPIRVISALITDGIYSMSNLFRGVIHGEASPRVISDELRDLPADSVAYRLSRTGELTPMDISSLKASPGAYAGDSDIYLPVPGKAPTLVIVKDQAALALPPGGIDLNGINVLRNGKTVNVQFDPAQLTALQQGGFQGFTPVIINITPISNPFQLLGINPAKQPELLVKT